MGPVALVTWLRLIQCQPIRNDPNRTYPSPYVDFSMEPRDDASQTVDETAPLLAQHQSTSSSSADAVSGAAGDAVSSTELKSPLYPYTLFFIFALSFIANLGDSLVDTPEVRLLEMAICRDYYLEHDPSVIGPLPRSYVDERLCKLNEIQVDLAYMRAVKSLLMTVPGET